VVAASAPLQSGRAYFGRHGSPSSRRTGGANLPAGRARRARVRACQSQLEAPPGAQPCSAAGKSVRPPVDPESHNGRNTARRGVTVVEVPVVSAGGGVTAGAPQTPASAASAPTARPSGPHPREKGTAPPGIRARGSRSTSRAPRAAPGSGAACRILVAATSTSRPSPRRSRARPRRLGRAGSLSSTIHTHTREQTKRPPTTCRTLCPVLR